MTVLHDLQEISRTRYVAPYEFAVVYAALGNKTKALLELQKTYREHSPWINNLYRDSRPTGRLNSLRDEPEFKLLLAEVGLPQE